MDKKVVLFLIKIGVPQYLKGFRYLVDVLLMIEQNPDFEYTADQLYKLIATKHCKSWQSVERNIRTCSKKMGIKYTNLDFINRLVNSYRLDVDLVNN